MTCKNFVDQEITELINTGRVKEVENVWYIVNPFSVSEKSDKLRLILKLRHVNMHAYKNNIKYENWDDMLNYVENECFMYKFDIKQGYHHIDIKPEHQKYLDFAWEINGFMFTVLPFGLPSLERKQY